MSLRNTRKKRQLLSWACLSHIKKCQSLRSKIVSPDKTPNVFVEIIQPELFSFSFRNSQIRFFSFLVPHERYSLLGAALEVHGFWQCLSLSPSLCRRIDGKKIFFIFFSDGEKKAKRQKRATARTKETLMPQKIPRKMYFFLSTWEKFVFLWENEVLSPFPSFLASS